MASALTEGNSYLSKTSMAAVTGNAHGRFTFPLCQSLLCRHADVFLPVEEEQFYQTNKNGIQSPARQGSNPSCSPFAPIARTPAWHTVDVQNKYF